jgi:hypothetical protein
LEEEYLIYYMMVKKIIKKDNITIYKEFKDLNDQKSDTKWLLFGYLDQYTVKIIQKGSNGSDEFKKCIIINKYRCQRRRDLLCIHKIKRH